MIVLIGCDIRYLNAVSNYIEQSENFLNCYDVDEETILWFHIQAYRCAFVEHIRGVYSHEWENIKSESSTKITNKLYREFGGFSNPIGLLPAWSGKLIWQWENDFIWEMIDSQEELNVPILVCEDDCDLSCIVIVAHIRKVKNAVYWERIGVCICQPKIRSTAH